MQGAAATPPRVFVPAAACGLIKPVFVPPKDDFEGLTILQEDDILSAGLPTRDVVSALDAVAQEVARLRKSVLKLGHAQELFQQKVESEIGRFAEGMAQGGRAPSDGVGASPDAAQQRALMEVDQAVLHLLDLAQGAVRAPAETPEVAPQSMREGLVLLQIRVRNLQRSFGLEPIPAVGRPFDDRCHRVHGICDQPGLTEGEVAEEILPGYRLGDKVVRPALVIVNRRKDRGEPIG